MILWDKLLWYEQEILLQARDVLLFAYFQWNEKRFVSLHPLMIEWFGSENLFEQKMMPSELWDEAG